MNRILASVVLSTTIAILLVGCKSGTEKKADEYLEAGKYVNAITLYTKVEQKGNASEEFRENFARAYTGMMAKMAGKDPMSGSIRGYMEQIPKYLADTKNTTIVEEFVKALLIVAEGRATQDDFGVVVEGFKALDIAEEWSKKHSVAQADVQKVRDQVEDKYAAKVIEMANLEDHSVAQEYQLLAGEVAIPKNKKLQEALNAVRKKNRGDFLIFEAAGIEGPSPMVNKYGLVMAFPKLSISGSSVTGELQFWNSTGNNLDLDATKIKIFSVDGKEALPNKGINVSCTDTDVEAKKKKVTKDVGKLLDERQCSMPISWNIPSGFVPDFVEYKDNMGWGRKYLGY